MTWRSRCLSQNTASSSTFCIGPISAKERKAVVAASSVAGVCERTVDRESAYAKLRSRIAASTPTINVPSDGGVVGTIKDALGGLMSGSGRKDSLVEAMAKSAARTVGSTVGRSIAHGVLGSLLGGRR
jgi:uncharacterized protein